MTDTTQNYKDTTRLINDVVKTLNNFRKNNDECVLRFTIEIMTKKNYEGDDEPMVKKRKRK